MGFFIDNHGIDGFTELQPRIKLDLTSSFAPIVLKKSMFSRRRSRTRFYCKVDDLAGHRLGEIIAFREGLHRVFFH